MSLVIPFKGENLDSLPFSLAVDIVSTYIHCQETITFMIQLLICRSETTV